MNGPLNLFVVVFALIFISTRISVDGSEGIECPVNSKPCVSFCCAWGRARWAGSCVEDNETSGILSREGKFFNDFEREISGQDYNFSEIDPCRIGWMASSVVESFSVEKNGSIHAPNFDKDPLSGFDEYCLFRYPKTTEYLAKICRPWVRKGYWEISCAVFAIAIMLAIFAGYTVVPVLGNLHGLIFRSYIASYIGIYICVLGVLFTAESRAYPFWFSFYEIGARYFSISCTFWLNVMSFNIWRSFRNLRPVNYNSNDRARRRICYATYAWFTPVVLIAVTAALIFCVPYFRDDIVVNALKQWGNVGLMAVGFFCNMILHISTAFKIRNFKKNTFDLVDGVNRHHEVERRWFSLYLNLFAMMGGHVIIWSIWLVWPTPVMTHSLAMIEVLQSVILFFVFIWKANYRRLVCEQVNSTLSRIARFCNKSNAPGPTVI